MVMIEKSRKVILGIIMMLNCPALWSTEPRVEKLWPHGAPDLGQHCIAEEPTLTVYFADDSNNSGAAVLILPGGGYAHLAIDHEGHQIAQWLNSFGVSGFIVAYRRGMGCQHPLPMIDAKRAIRTVRSRAVPWKINPRKIGVMGFSAGGHLASSTGTLFDPGDPKADDPVERLSSRPDFMILCYPVISMTSEYTHQGSKKNLLGENPDAVLVEHLSTDLQVTADTPPTFLFHTSEDKGVPPQNSILFYLALHRAGVPVEMHIFEKGRHGLGLAQSDPFLAVWPELCRNWLKNRGFVPDH